MQGIEEPIRGGDVRDNVDKYKVNFILRMEIEAL